MSGTVVRHRFARPGALGAAGARARIREAVRYLTRRSRGATEREGDRALFDRAVDSMERAGACTYLAARATADVACHRLVLSPGADSDAMTRDELLLWARRVMADLEAQTGRRVAWVAAVHRHTAHPHVHVLVGAAADRPDGTREEVRFTPAAYAILRESGDHWAQRARDDHALMRDVARHLARSAASMTAGVARYGSAGHQRRDDEHEEEHRRRDGRQR